MVSAVWHAQAESGPPFPVPGIYRRSPSVTILKAERQQRPQLKHLAADRNTLDGTFSILGSGAWNRCHDFIAQTKCLCGAVMSERDWQLHPSRFIFHEHTMRRNHRAKPQQPHGHKHSTWTTFHRVDRSPPTQSAERCCICRSNSNLPRTNSTRLGKRRRISVHMQWPFPLSNSIYDYFVLCFVGDIYTAYYFAASLLTPCDSLPPLVSGLSVCPSVTFL